MLFFVKYNIDNYLTKSYNDTTKFVKKNIEHKKPIKLIKKLEVSQDGKERRTGKSSEIIDNVDALIAKMDAMREAQREFATFTQEQVDKIFYEAASAKLIKMRLPRQDGSGRNRHGCCGR